MIVPCECGKEFNIYGGEPLSGGLYIRVVAVCDGCDTIFGYDPFQKGFKSKKHASNYIKTTHKYRRIK